MKEKIYRAFLEGLEKACNVSVDEGIFPKSESEQDAIDDYDERFLVRFTYNSNSIEGSTLTINDTELIFEGEFPSDPQDKQLKDVFAAIGIKEGTEYALQCLKTGRKLDEELIKDIHQRTALDCQPRTRGVYRTIPAYIKHSTTVPVAPERIREHMADLFFAYGNSTLHPIAKAAAFHAMFENIHPFRDGNGRAGRIILNYMLQQEGYPPIAIKAASKNEYAEALNEWQIESKPVRLITLIEQQLVEEMASRKSLIDEVRRVQPIIEGQERAAG